MRSVPNSVWRATVGLSIFAAGWAPAAVIAFWGGSYFLRCLNAMTSPGVPIEYRYESEAGVVLVRATGYHFDPGTMEGLLTGISVTGPDGKEVATCQTADVGYQGGVIVVRLNNPHVTLRRRSDGTFNVQHMAPKKIEDAASEGAFRLAVRNAHVNYIDEAVGGDSISIQLPQATVDGWNGSYAFSSDMTTKSVNGLIHGTMTKSDGLVATVSLDDAEVAWALPYIEPFIDENIVGEFATIKAKSLVVNGTSTLAVNSVGSASLSGDFELVGEGVTSPYSFRSASLTASATSDGSLLALSASLSQTGLTMEFDGTLQTHGAFRLAGRLSADARSQVTAPPQLRPFIDPGVHFENAQFVGTIDTDGERFLFDGKATIAQIDYSGETIDSLESVVRLNERSLTAQLENGSWSGVDFYGAIQVDFESGRLSGGLDSRKGRLDVLAEKFGIERLEGDMSLTAVLGGTTSDPFADFYARGSGDYRLTDGSVSHLGVFEMRGKLDTISGRLNRFELIGQNGMLVGNGYMDWGDGRVELDLAGGGIDVASFVKEAQGLGFINFQVRGTRTAPQYSGRAELYGVEAFSRRIPQAVADFTTEGRTVNVERFALRAGTGQVDGDLKIDLDSGALDGSYAGKGIRLEEWLALETVGAAQVQEGSIFGTIDDPRAKGIVTAEQFFANGMSVESAAVPYVLDRQSVVVDAFQVKIGAGTLTGSGEHKWDSTNTSFQGTFSDLPIESFNSDREAIDLSGLGSGEFSATNSGGGWLSRLLCDLTEVTVNKTPVGQGWLEVGFEGPRVKIDGQVGSIERYLQIDGLQYDSDTKQIGGGALLYNILMEDVLSATKKSIDRLGEPVQSLAADARGVINADVIVSGTPDQPQINVASASLSDLLVGNRPAGVLKTQAQYIDGVWNVSMFDWENGDTKLTASGRFGHDGQYDVTADLNNFDTSWIHTLFPQTPRILGLIDASFKGAGDIDDPKGEATLIAHDLGFDDGAKKVSVPLTLELDSITAGERALDVHGQVSFRGLNAEVFGFVPFGSLYGEDSRAVDVSATVNDRDLSEYAPLFVAIDGTRSDGRINGLLGIRGGWDTLEPFADLRIHGKTLALNGYETTIKDYEFVTSLNGTAASLKGDFKGDLGGKGSFEAQATLPEGVARGEVDLDALKNSPLTGSVVISDMQGRLTLPTAKRASRATVSTTGVAVGGTIGAPIVSGEFLLSDLYVRLPESLDESRSPIIYPIDPVFRGVTVSAAPGSVIDSGNARIEFFGKGRLDGSLQNPDVTLPLKVSGGVLMLPTARISIEENGDVTVGYRASLGDAPTARVDLNLEGTTTVSARRVDNQYETYPVHLDIRGNLLEDNGLMITATSDPPDLSSDEIMAILGRKELIEEFAKGSESSKLESIYTAAIPAAANLLTYDLANNLGLDYISIDYNPLDQTIAGFGKSLGTGLMFHASRQLSSSAGERLKYEVQLTYRLPLQNRVLSRIRFGIEADQDVPWRLRLNWARRF